MDKETFKLLMSFYGKEPVFIFDSPMKNTKTFKNRSYNYLLENGYIEYNKATGLITITIEGNQYVEQRLQNEYLIELQKQNLMIQKHLKSCQIWLLLFTAISLVISVFECFRK